MSTLFELIDKHNVKYSDNLERMIEEYFDTRFPEPDPQPIDKLFEMEEDAWVFIKSNSKSGSIFGGYYYSIQKLLEVHQDPFNKDSAGNLFKSFIIAEIPKF